MEKIKKIFDEAEQGGFSINRNSLHWGQLASEKGYYRYIFDHEFIQAIFGDGDHYTSSYNALKTSSEENGIDFDPELLPLPLWKKMLQQMVLVEDPLSWLVAAIDNKDKYKNLGEGVVKGTKDTSAIREKLKQELKDQFKNL